MENKIRNIKAYSAPTLWIDIDDLHIPCAVPTVELTEAILEKAQVVTELTNGKVSQEGYDAAFDLFAEILSCNHNFVTFTADELKARRITTTQVVGILIDWVRFIGSLTELKN
jgi:hypothetical protein